MNKIKILNTAMNDYPDVLGWAIQKHKVSSVPTFIGTKDQKVLADAVCALDALIKHHPESTQKLREKKKLLMKEAFTLLTWVKQFKLLGIVGNAGVMPAKTNLYKKYKRVI